MWHKIKRHRVIVKDESLFQTPALQTSHSSSLPLEIFLAKFLLSRSSGVSISFVTKEFSIRLTNSHPTRAAEEEEQLARLVVDGDAEEEVEYHNDRRL